MTCYWAIAVDLSAKAIAGQNIVYAVIGFAFFVQFPTDQLFICKLTIYKLHFVRCNCYTI